MKAEPAFPTGLIGQAQVAKDRYEVSEYESKHTGMTLRDYFAGQVISHIYTDFWAAVRADKGQFNADWPMELAMEAYKMADAMLRAREEQ